jgi:hypothetical protein
MATQEEKENLKSWGEAHVPYGLVQARIALSLLQENRELRALNESLAERIAAQSELLAKKAEKV